MSVNLYPKLAWSNIWKNRQTYLPYLLTFLVTVSMFYIIGAITANPGISDLPGGATLQVVLGLGQGVIAIFAMIFLFYTNSFLIKQRKKELGLYYILGMEKKHIAHIMFWEAFYISLSGTVIGIGLGILFNKLIIMLMMRMLDLDVVVPFEISKISMMITVILFVVIFLLILCGNARMLRKSHPIDLLHGEQIGEKEPKAKKLMTLLGILCLGGGYAIAIMTKNPLQAVMLFFVAVDLVIAGTYLLFITGSITILKGLKRQKRFYYRPTHFTAISGMIYRMKQNAVGLANICILSTMVLVMVSSTVCMNMGSKDMVQDLAPKDINTYLHTGKGLIEEGDWEAARKRANKVHNEEVAMVTKEGYEIADPYQYEFFELRGRIQEDGELQMGLNMINGTESGGVVVQIIYQSAYENCVQESVKLRSNEALFDVIKGEYGKDQFQIYGKKYDLRSADMRAEFGNDMDMCDASIILVVRDEEYRQIYNQTIQLWGVPETNYRSGFDVVADKKEKAEICRKCNKKVEQILTDENRNELYYEVRDKNEVELSVHALYGGFMFLGIFLGLLFIIATVLIIYYKQISEGYEDRERFWIMQKVGMSREEVNKSIRCQIFLVFFLPLIVACVHCLAAFPMICRVLSVMALDKVSLFIVCTLATMGIFALIYTVVYFATAKTYYQLVQR